jgi:hypothetical protein
VAAQDLLAGVETVFTGAVVGRYLDVSGVDGMPRSPLFRRLFDEE